MKKVFYKINRWFNKLYADLFEYYWLPCILCGEYRGGHENKLRGSIPTDNPYMERQICDKCEKERKKKPYLFSFELKKQAEDLAKKLKLNPNQYCYIPVLSQEQRDLKLRGRRGYSNTKLIGTFTHEERVLLCR